MDLGPIYRSLVFSNFYAKLVYIFVCRIDKKNPKFDEITKFEILNPKIQNFQFRQNLTKNQNSATVVYHNFAIPPKFESQNFPKFVPIWANNRDKLFQNFEVDIKITKMTLTAVRNLTNVTNSCRQSDTRLTPPLLPSTSRHQYR